MIHLQENIVLAGGATRTVLSKETISVDHKKVVHLLSSAWMSERGIIVHNNPVIGHYKGQFQIFLTNTAKHPIVLKTVNPVGLLAKLDTFEVDVEDEEMSTDDELETAMAALA